mmetsp:Transcript_68690/g.149515  ORF Transcript_68690/g.149515 Transcript_68690/m.149515 type:complete len:82 (-) Transcript_68690:209-454(-)|eukprot:CAMPEP_0170596964 /NCGR_PEP_ID=MMETSP0224-20130122/15435_1 /TAXON_ID=285029 /ORGANISM="Togula jolla, Strain CCCM 725" /LENGTH=81 /DNA_ID=CAMNT_0010921365 /DNA_START=57 /DNA_END=302 /DNA_ORIENTATION=+
MFAFLGGGEEASKDAARKAARKQLEEDVPKKAPCYVKMFFPCCGIIGAIKLCFPFLPRKLKDEVREPLKTIKEERQAKKQQ